MWCLKLPKKTTCQCFDIFSLCTSTLTSFHLEFVSERFFMLYSFELFQLLTCRKVFYLFPGLKSSGLFSACLGTLCHIRLFRAWINKKLKLKLVTSLNFFTHRMTSHPVNIWVMINFDVSTLNTQNYDVFMTDYNNSCLTLHNLLYKQLPNLARLCRLFPPLEGSRGLEGLKRTVTFDPSPSFLFDDQRLINWDQIKTRNILRTSQRSLNN